MDEATMKRAFEAFYTTKGPGKGTGLGLYIVEQFGRIVDGWKSTVSPATELRFMFFGLLNTTGRNLAPPRIAESIIGKTAYVFFSPILS